MASSVANEPFFGHGADAVSPSTASDGGGLGAHHQLQGKLHIPRPQLRQLNKRLLKDERSANFNVLATHAPLATPATSATELDTGSFFDFGCHQKINNGRIPSSLPSDEFSGSMTPATPCMASANNSNLLSPVSGTSFSTESLSTSNRGLSGQSMLYNPAIKIPACKAAYSLRSAASLSSAKSVQSNISLPQSELEQIDVVGSAELAQLLSASDPTFLLLDVRPFAQYQSEHIKDSLNVCVPSTLLKRPAFTISKVLDSLAPEQRHLMKNWMEKKRIVLYDASTISLSLSCPVYQTAKKFLNEEKFNGRVAFLRGGIAEFSKNYGPLIEKDFEDDEHQENGSKSSKSTEISDATIAARAPCVMSCSGLRLPNLKKLAAATPFFSNIRQNTDLINGVGEPIPINAPSTLIYPIQRRLPAWLKSVVLSRNGASLVANRFLEIEKSEQGRLQAAFSRSNNCSEKCECPGENDSDKKLKCYHNYSISAAIERGAKNRYNNIFPYDHTRVKLECGPGSSDYINASFVSVPFSMKRYIATQGPLPDTFEDFWSVVWSKNVRVIVMLTPVVEGGQVKCHSYWNESRYGRFILNTIYEEEVRLSQRTETKVQVRKFTLLDTEDSGKQPLEVTHIQYVSWPDLGAPADPIDIVSLSQLADSFNQPETDKDAMIIDDVQPQNPVIVHCSAGCGRTGTFCTVDTVIDILKHQKEFLTDCVSGLQSTEDLVYKVVNDFRTQRLSMVQSLRQFVICYESVLVWVVDRLNEQVNFEEKGKNCQV
ncbi:protein-tyrosine phosphatase-like protein [Dipodascopsis uninucleata]